MLDQILQKFIRQAVFVHSWAVVEYAVALACIGSLNSAVGLHDCPADVFRGLAYIPPADALRNIKSVLLLPFKGFLAAFVIAEDLLAFLVVYIAYPLEKTEAGKPPIPSRYFGT